jgi:hypothetical protein
MPNFPCPINQPCPDGGPFANLSSEAPDVLVFIGYNFGWGNGGNYLLGDRGGNPDFFGSCESPISQAEADQCAAGDQIRGGTGDGPSSNPGPGLTPITLYHNQTVGCTVFCPDGTPANGVTLSGQIEARTQAQANSIAQGYACQRANLNKLCMGELQSTACLNQTYSSAITSTKPIAEIQITSGMVPPGLFFQESASGNPILAGTPTLAGTFTFTLHFIAQTGQTTNKAFTITVLGITNGDPTDATQGTAYSFQFTAAGGTPPYTFALEAGPLPAGITLDNNGLLSGTPTEDGDFNITVSVTDSAP